MDTSPTDPIAGMSLEEKKNLLRRLLAKKTDPHSQPFGLSRGQQALWFLQRLMPDNYAYNIPVAMRFSPPIDLRAFQSALDALVARHPALRTRCYEDSGIPSQQVASVAVVPIDQRAAPESQLLLKDEVIAESRRPFAMDGPLWRATIWHGAASDVFLLTIHHLIFDGRSAAILLRDFSALYDSALGVTSAPLTPLPATYRDFVTAQEELLDSADGDRLWEFWSRELAGEVDDFALPPSPVRSEQLSLQGESVAFAVPSVRTADIVALAHVQRTTIYAVIFSAMQILLYHFTGQSNLVIGTPAAGRTKLEWANVVGYFVNMLPMRVPFSPDRTFASHLQDVHTRIARALDHQDFPFPAMVERLKIARDPARSPIFQVTVNVTQLTPHMSAPSESSATNSLTWKFGNSIGSSFMDFQLEGQFDLAVQMLEIGGELYGSWQFGTHSIERATAVRLLNEFQAILRLATEEPELPIRKLLDRLDGLALDRSDKDREEVKF